MIIAEVVNVTVIVAIHTIVISVVMYGENFGLIALLFFLFLFAFVAI